MKLNLKGFMVGNGVTNWNLDVTPAWLQMAYWHGFYSDELKQKLDDNDCYYQYTPFVETPSPICEEAVHEFEQSLDYIDVTYIYGPCSGAATDSDLVQRLTMQETIPWYHNLKGSARGTSLRQIVGCSYDVSFGYLNRRDV
mmetsp:Transcript_6851/g.6062  ORF Transcript_6851/g.6062 Transcript_6851/m.6062 type:complete len:141 (-) Transcript_6851:153-575(-)